MIFLFFFLLLLITLAGGAVPLLMQLPDSWNKNILAFSGAVLLGISFLHLLPESYADVKLHVGIYILIGFFLQLSLQKFSHGLEHGHVHIHTDVGQHHHIHLTPVLVGLSVHAFLEGIPLGYNFAAQGTTPSLFLGTAAHKAPEAITLMSVLSTMQIPRAKKWLMLFGFAILSPIAGLLAMYFGENYFFVANMLKHIVPVVIGAFIHISTTIFFESGTKHHEMDLRKIIAIAIGLLFSIATLAIH